MIFGWFILSVIVGVIGSGRNIGFFGAFFLSLILSPLIGIIITLISKSPEDEDYKKKVLKTQIAQTAALKKLSSKSSESKLSIADEIKKLEQLKNDKLISEEEFNTLRQKIINN